MTGVNVSCDTDARLSNVLLAHAELTTAMIHKSLPELNTQEITDTAPNMFLFGAPCSGKTSFLNSFITEGLEALLPTAAHENTSAIIQIIGVPGHGATTFEPVGEWPQEMMAACETEMRAAGSDHEKLRRLASFIESNSADLYFGPLARVITNTKAPFFVNDVPGSLTGVGAPELKALLTGEGTFPVYVVPGEASALHAACSALKPAWDKNTIVVITKGDNLNGGSARRMFDTWANFPGRMFITSCVDDTGAEPLPRSWDQEDAYLSALSLPALPVPIQVGTRAVYEFVTTATREWVTSRLTKLQSAVVTLRNRVNAHPVMTTTPETRLNTMRLFAQQKAKNSPPPNVLPTDLKAQLIAEYVKVIVSAYPECVQAIVAGKASKALSSRLQFTWIKDIPDMSIRLPLLATASSRKTQIMHAHVVSAQLIANQFLSEMRARPDLLLPSKSELPAEPADVLDKRAALENLIGKLDAMIAPLAAMVPV